MVTDEEEQRALIDELRSRIPSGAQKRFAIAIAGALGTGLTTEEPRLSRVLGGDLSALSQLLVPERCDAVLAAIGRELGLADPLDLLDAARKAVRSRPRPAADRHPAWLELGEETPWVDAVPGLTEGVATLGSVLAGVPSPDVVWLVGGSGSGKSAWLCRAQRAGLGTLCNERPGEPARGSVFLVDEPCEVDAWLAWANRWRVQLVIAVPCAPASRKGARTIELHAWSAREVEVFVAALRRVRLGSSTTLDAADIDRIVDRLAIMGGAWTPLDLGHALRFMVDHPDRAFTQTSAELRLQIAFDQLTARGAVPPSHDPSWRSHGRQAAARTAALALRSARGAAMTGAVAPRDVDAELARLVGIAVGGRDGEPLTSVLGRAKKDSSKKPMAKLEEWAAQPSATTLVEMLVQVGLFRREPDGSLAAANEELVIMLAAEVLDDGWMWERLVETLADPAWSPVRRMWAARLGQVERRIDHLLGTRAAVHVGAVELATALAAYAVDSPRPEQLERVVFSAVQLCTSHQVIRAQLGLSRDRVIDDLRVVSRRHRRLLPSVSTAWDTRELAGRGTQTTTRILQTLERMGSRTAPSFGVPTWVTCACLLPWQALELLKFAQTRGELRSRQSWQSVIVDHATDGDPWAMAIATGDVEDISEACELVSGTVMADALCRWRGPRDRGRHERAIARVLSRGGGEPQTRDGEKAVRAIADLVRSHPDQALPQLHYLAQFDRIWCKGLERASSSRLLGAWFEAESQAFEAAVDERRGQRLLRIADALYRIGSGAALGSLLAQPTGAPVTPGADVRTQISVDAARALLRHRAGDVLRHALAGRGASGDAVRAALRDIDDDDSAIWIADTVGHRYEEILARVPGRPGWRDFARRWARDAPSPRRDAAAAWLLEHGQAGEHDCVVWLLRDLPVYRAAHHAERGLAHPDDMVRLAAAGLLKRALAEASPSDRLMNVARCFIAASEPESLALLALLRFLERVNVSRQILDADSLQAFTGLLLAYLKDCPAEDLGIVVELLGATAVATSHVSPVLLSRWLSGLSADDANVSDAVDLARRAIARALVGVGVQLALDRDVLQSIADWELIYESIPAHRRLLELQAPDVASLLAEWSTVSDTALVGEVSASARWYAISELLQQQAPDLYATAFADRLIALPSTLKPLAVMYVSQVAMCNPREAERLSVLFD